MGIISRMFGRGERRSATQLHPGDPALVSWLGIANTIPNINVTPEKALACPAVYAPVRLISGALSVMELDLYQKDANGPTKKDDGNLLYDLVKNRPNDYQTGAQFKKSNTERMLAFGNAYSRIDRPGAPRGLWPMHPRRVMPFRDSQNRIWYRYTPPDGKQMDLSKDEVLHLRYGPATDDDGLEAASPIMIHRETIALAMAATEYLSRFFANYATPKTVLEVPQVLKAGAGEKLRDDWMARHAGLANAHSLAILDGGMKMTPISTTNQDAQFVETYRSVSGEISGKVYGLPPHLGGDANATSSWGTGIEQMTLGYIQQVLSPIMEEWEQGLDGTLLSSSTRRSSCFVLDVENLLRGDFKSRMDGYALMIQWAIATPNEVRSKLGLPHIKGGDERLQPLNMVAADQALAILSADKTQAKRAIAKALGFSIED